MAPAPVAQGLLTFLFTDIVGSTQLWERAPQAARQAVARHYIVLQREVRANRGTIFKTVGDACCCVFEDPLDALSAAMAIQRALEAEAWPAEAGALRVRIGIHTGEAIADQGDYFGPTLNRVARLMAAAHGGQIVLSSSTAEHVARRLPPECTMLDLGAHRLKDLAEPQHVYQVLASGLPVDFPALASLDSTPNNLPSQLDDFVGRDAELARLRELLGAGRFVTICGVGGIGKTRLALQAAAETIGSYADGSWFVRLADIADGDLIVQTVATALGVSGAPGQALEQTLTAYLRSKNLFLLLDNAEHVLGAAARAVRALLSACPNLTVLVTSREPLHVAGEQVLRVGALSAADAQKLFVHRANMSAADAYVADICRELDGLPLAIELAAGRIGTLTTKQLEERLHAMLPGLASKDSTQEARHRTLDATIDWSYRLLNPKEQRFFGLLAVFDGGFTIEACEAVAWAGEEDDPAYALLDALVDKSFVAAEPTGDSMRYRLLEALRRFACAKLDEGSQAAMARSLHFAYFKAFADRWGTWPSEGAERAYVAAFEREVPNLRSALDWGLKQPEVAPALELLLSVAQYWQQHCNTAEGRAWLTRACEVSSGSQSALHAKLLRRAATFATIEDDYSAARELTAKASALFERLDDGAGSAEALHNLAVIEQRSGSEDEALRLYRRALSLFERTGHAIGTITATYNIALTLKRRGDLAGAREYLERGMALCDSAAHGDRMGTFWMLRGEIEMREGQLADAALSLQRAVLIKRDLGNRHDEVEALCTVAVLEMRRGDWVAAARNAHDALMLARDLDVPSLVIACFETSAVLLGAMGNAQLARELIAVTKAMRGEKGYRYGIMDELAPDLAAFSDVQPALTVPDDVRRVIDELTQGHFV